jgi:hypothetical protein
VPSSSALPGANDEAARWHRLRFSSAGRVEVAIRQWSADESRFVEAGGYELCLPRRMTDASPVARSTDRAGMWLAPTAA